MPRNFDEEKADDLEFTIGGEKFTMKFVRPEVIAAWEDEPADTSSAAALQSLDKRIGLFLGGNGEIERWQALRAREENPVTMGQLNSLLMWMIEVQSGRPTMPPSPSASGRGRTVVPSKGA